MVDGRRLDNDASSFGGARSKSKNPIDLVGGIDGVERIEVIKGSGGAAYGAEASGGIINIITRQGRDRQETGADVGAGSWGGERYSLTQSGPIFTDRFRYFVSGSYQAGDDTKYKDGDTDKTLTYLNTRYREASANGRLDYDLTDNQTLSLYYTWSHSKDHYPITAPDSDTMYLFENSQLPRSSTAPGYRNWFLYDAQLGSYNEDKVSDVDLKYTFDKSGGLTSFVRGYRNSRTYFTRDFGGLFNIQPKDVTQALIDKALMSAGRRRHEKVDGAEVQLAHQFGINHLIFGLDYRESEFESINLALAQHTFVNRNAYKGFLQDKIDLTSRWTISPGVLYNRYSTIKRKSATDVVTTKGDSVAATYALHSNYTFDSIGDFYISWQQIFRPLANYDYDSESTVPLHDERGDSWTAGIRKTLADKTFLAVSYQLLDMSNAIGRYSIFDPTAVNSAAPTGFGAFVNKSVNATQKKKSLNLMASHQFTPNWAVTASYTYVMEDFKAKEYEINPDDTSNVNALVNRFRPPNTYQADVVYGMNRFSATVSATLYTGNNTAYFSDKQFAVFDLVANYDLFEKTRVYLSVDNLTNIAWENKANPNYGPGAFPQPGRNFFAGIQQKF
jgi:iron complex outermembrane receptor protein